MNHSRTDVSPICTDTMPACLCSLISSQLDEVTKRFEEEVSRLTKDNELLRGQLAQMSASIQVGCRCSDGTPVKGIHAYIHLIRHPWHGHCVLDVLPAGGGLHLT
jgi:hypothetical protein